MISSIRKAVPFINFQVIFEKFYLINVLPERKGNGNGKGTKYKELQQHEFFK